MEWNLGGCGGRGGHGSGGSGDCGAYDLLGQITFETLDLWPPSVPVEYLPFEAGNGVHTGLKLLSAPPSNPCRLAYVTFCTVMTHWCVPGRGRSSWDPMAVVFAVRGADGMSACPHFAHRPSPIAHHDARSS